MDFSNYLQMIFLLEILFIKRAHTSQYDYENIVFNFSFQVDSSFSFNLDSLESDPWSSTDQILTNTSDCSIDSVEIFIKQSFNYNFTDKSHGLSLETMLISNQFIYLIFIYSDSQNSSRNLRVYNLIIDDINYQINDLQLLLQKDIPIGKSVTFIEKNENFLVLSTEDNLFVYNENSSIVSYTLNLIDNFSMPNSLANPPATLFWNEDIYSLIFPLKNENFLMNPSINSVSKINDPENLILAQRNMLISCMNYVFFYDNGFIYIKEMTNLSNSLSFSFIKTIPTPIENLQGLKRVQRSLIFYNLTHVYESIFVNDCLDIQPFGLYSIQGIYNQSNQPYSNEVISSLYVETSIFIIQTNTNDTFLKRLEISDEKFWPFLFKNPIVSYSILEFLPFHMKDMPILGFLIYNDTAVILNLQLFDKSEETLHCELTSDSLSILISTSIRFCNNSLYNFTEEIDNNNTVFDPNVTCVQYSNFLLSKQGLGISIKVIISTSSVIFGLCVFISICYLVRKLYRRRKRRAAYFDDGYNDNFEDDDKKAKENIPLHSYPEVIDSARFRGNSPATTSHREFLNRNGEIEFEKKKNKEAKDKAELEMSRISLKLEDISFTTPQKSEENRRLGEEIAEESKSQVAKMMIFVKEDFH